MKIEIKLGDPRFCDGCPCLYDESPSCNLSFDLGKAEKRHDGKSNRPQECIDKHGE